MKNRSRIMKSFPITLMAFLLVLSFGSIVAEASPLAGKSLQGVNEDGGFQPSPIAVVGAGVEYPSVDYFGSDWFQVDISETGLVTVAIKDVSLGHGASQLLTFTDIHSDIDNITGFTFMGVSPSGSVIGFNQSKLSFTADSFSVQLGSGVDWAPFSSIQAQLGFTSVSVPEPATMLLLGLGLLGLAGVRRKLQK